MLRRRSKTRPVMRARCGLKVLWSSSERPGCEPSVCSILNRPLREFLPSAVHSLRSFDREAAFGQQRAAVLRRWRLVIQLRFDLVRDVADQALQKLPIWLLSTAQSTPGMRIHRVIPSALEGSALI